MDPVVPLDSEPLLEPPSPTSSLQPAGEILESEHDVITAKYIEACQKGDIATVRDLLESHAVEIGSDVDSNGVSGLHWAAINNRLSLVKYLVERGAEVDKEGGEIIATPLHWACRYGLVYIVDYLLSKGADPTKTDSQGFNALLLATHSSNIMLIIHMLFSTELAVDAVDPNGRTALHWAAYQGDALTVDVLLKFNASVRAVDSQGFIPLHWALIRGQKDCLKRLLEEGSDVNATTNENKTSFDVAVDMNSLGSLKLALFESGFQESGEPLKRYFTAHKAKAITFLCPYVILGALFKIIGESHPLFSLLCVLVSFFVSSKLLEKYLLPCYERSSHPFFNSPLMAGIFSSSVFWVVVSWVSVLLPYTATKAPFTNLVFIAACIATIYSFWRAMFKDPGFIEPPESPTEIKAAIKQLLAIGKYDAKNFCINTFNRKPLRSKYSQFSKKLIARFDHSCPWVYNDIGHRNHKVFIFFVMSLEVAIIAVLVLIAELFDRLEDDNLTCVFLDTELCSGLTYAPFTFVLGVWSLFQVLWLTFLLFSQWFQISKGVTTQELSNLNRHDIADYSSTPLEMRGTDVLNMGTVIRREKNCFNTLCLLTGLDQFAIALRQTLGIKHPGGMQGIPMDYGMKQNLLDFWFAPGDDSLKVRNFFRLPVRGEGNLNGELVDYYKLYELPPKKPAYDSA